jgi:hypothetical protein
MANTALADGLLKEMAEAESGVFDSYMALQSARTRYQIAARKYAALRDVAGEILGAHPYDPSIEWPADALKAMDGKERGGFQYIYTPVGRAILYVLQAAENPLTLEEIYSALYRGELTTSMRAVNAALMKLANVEKVGETYRYKPPEGEAIDPDDLPFE